MHSSRELCPLFYALNVNFIFISHCFGHGHRIFTQPHSRLFYHTSPPQSLASFSLPPWSHVLFFLRCTVIISSPSASWIVVSYIEAMARIGLLYLCPLVHIVTSSLCAVSSLPCADRPFTSTPNLIIISLLNVLTFGALNISSIPSAEPWLKPSLSASPLGLDPFSCPRFLASQPRSRALLSLIFSLKVVFIHFSCPWRLPQCHRSSNEHTS